MSSSTNGAGRKWAARNGHRGGIAPKKYSAWSLIRHGLSGADWPQILRRHDRRDSYDVVIIGGGVHGLATAYYLAADHGVGNVAVLEKSYIGSGGSGATPQSCAPTT